MENLDLSQEDFFTFAMRRPIPSIFSELNPGDPPIPEEPEPEPEPPVPLLLPPPRNLYDRTDSFHVRTVTDPETGYSLIISRKLRIWLFGTESARLEYGEGGVCVFARWPEPELSEELMEKFGYDPSRFPPHIHDLRARRSRLPWSHQEESVLYLTLELFIPLETLSGLLCRRSDALIGRLSRFRLKYRFKWELRNSWWWGVYRVTTPVIQELMIRNNRIINILETPHYQGRLQRRIRVIG